MHYIGAVYKEESVETMGRSSKRKKRTSYPTRKAPNLDLTVVLTHPTPVYALASEARQTWEDNYSIPKLLEGVVPGQGAGLELGAGLVVETAFLQAAGRT